MFNRFTPSPELHFHITGTPPHTADIESQRARLQADIDFILKLKKTCGRRLFIGAILFFSSIVFSSLLGSIGSILTSLIGGGLAVPAFLADRSLEAAKEVAEPQLAQLAPAQDETLSSLAMHIDSGPRPAYLQAVIDQGRLLTEREALLLIAYRISCNQAERMASVHSQVYGANHNPSAA